MCPDGATGSLCQFNTTTNNGRCVQRARNVERDGEGLCDADGWALAIMGASFRVRRRWIVTGMDTAPSSMDSACATWDSPGAVLVSVAGVGELSVPDALLNANRRDVVRAITSSVEGSLNAGQCVVGPADLTKCQSRRTREALIFVAVMLFFIQYTSPRPYRRHQRTSRADVHDRVPIAHHRQAS